jgi:ribosomal protein L37AE/L43A
VKGSFLASRSDSLVCPLCEAGELRLSDHTSARCASCASLLNGAMVETLRQITALPEGHGSHPCECGHPEMRGLPDGVYHCPACRSEVLPFETCRSLTGSPAGSMEAYTDFPAGGAGETAREQS